MKVLVINAGSSSIKYQLMDMKKEEVVAKGLVEKIGIPDSQLTHKINGQAYEFKKDLKDHAEGLKLVLKTLQDPKIGAIKSLDEIDAIGHRVLHGGTIYSEATLVTPKVIKDLEKLIPLGPLHMPANIEGIKACQKVMKGKPNVALFDTGFHATMPDYASTYAVPYEWKEKYGVRKYGFHGMSHEFIASEVVRITGKKNLRIINCHIGNGASVCAIKNGKCVDTSMGLTPLEGLVMGSRSGDLDPAVLEFVMDKTGMNINEMLTALNKKSGILGISGVSSDQRYVFEAANKGDARSQLAIDVMIYRIKKYIGSYAAAMGGVDVIVFTAGAGENGSDLRGLVMKDMEFLGVDFDEKANKNFKRGEVNLLSKKRSKVKVYMIPTNEELLIARETARVVKNSK